MSRRVFVRQLAGLALAPAALAPASASVRPGPTEKVLRHAFPIAETNFDPAQITDVYSRVVCANLFEAPLEWAYMTRPAALRPCTAVALPEISENFTRFVLTLQPGIRFADDPAFNGQPRELVAADYVYSLKRHYDPRWKSGSVYLLESAGVLGLSELRKEALATKKPFDYDREVEGLRVLDRYRFEIRLARPDPRFHYHLGDAGFCGAVAREVVERYGERIGEHPVGTGAFRLAAWKRSSRIEVERNPNFRDLRHDEHPNPADKHLVQMADALRGQRLPLADRMVVSIIEEAQPRWLSFLNAEQDFIERVPEEFTGLAAPGGKLAGNLARRGVGLQRYYRSDIAFTYFAMEHPVVGGYTPDKVALRRAISLSVDLPGEIANVRRGQAVAAQSVVAPETWGYDTRFKSEMSDYDPPRARALLDLHGYVDRNGDGWRELPDGSPLVLRIATQPDQLSRQQDEQWRKNLQAVGIRVEFVSAKWPENLKASRAGKLMMWQVAWSATNPDGDYFLATAYGPNKGQSNHSRFDLPAYNRAFEAQKVLPDGPERQQRFDEAKRLAVAYMPMKVHVHRIWTDLHQPWVIGYHRNVFARNYWKYLGVDAAARAAGGGA